MLRKTLIFIFPLIVLLAFTVSCSDDPIESDNPVEPVLEIHSELYPFSPRAGNANLSFDSNLPWKASASASEGSGDWFTVSPLSGEAGERITLNISVKANEEYTGRSFLLTIDNGSIEKSVEVTQLKKNVILLGDNLCEVTSDGQTVSVEVRSNVEYSVSITAGKDWIGEVTSRSDDPLTRRTHTFSVSQNTVESNRTGKVVFKDLDSNLSDEFTIVQQAWIDTDPERTGLIALYESAGGTGWTNSSNWCSDRPLDEWYGVETDSEGHVTAVRLSNNNLKGVLPARISKLAYLKHLDLSWNSLSGELGSTNEADYISKLFEIETINLSHNELTGTFPNHWNNLTKLTLIDVSSNNFNGPIPYQWAGMFQDGRWVELIVYNNIMYGNIPGGIQNHPEWDRLAFQIMRQRPQNGRMDIIKDYFMPDLTLVSVRDGSEHSMRQIYGNNKYTMIFNWDPLDEESTGVLASLVRRYYTLYNGQGFGVIAITPEGDQYRQAARDYVAAHDIPWLTITDYRDAQGRRIILMPYPYPSYLMLDKDGKVILDMFNGQSDNPEMVDLSRLSHYDYLNTFFKNKIGNPEYKSVDYSMDKQYERLQGATKGKGIDIIFMGDAYQDVDIQTGYYKKLMELLMEYFFSIEPTKSYREYFNVYMVYAVSEPAYIGEYPTTALGTTYYGGISDGTQVFDYIGCVPLTGYDAITTVSVNNIRAGVTFLGSGKYLSYVNISYKYLRTLLIHESVGHGLGLLGDEYANLITIPETQKNFLRSYQSKGMFLNVSLTGDPSSVYWSHLIGHSRYPYVGVHEGAYNYKWGVWRSEDISIMSTATVLNDSYYFNAISRQLIVKRILELSGEGYTFEKFLSKDSDEGRPVPEPFASGRAPQEAVIIHRPPVVVLEQNY